MSDIASNIQPQECSPSVYTKSQLGGVKMAQPWISARLHAAKADYLRDYQIENAAPYICQRLGVSRGKGKEFAAAFLHPTQAIMLLDDYIDFIRPFVRGRGVRAAVAVPSQQNLTLALASAEAFRLAIDALPVGRDIRSRLAAHLDAHIATIRAIGAAS